jgi:hypothetical protein
MNGIRINNVPRDSRTPEQQTANVAAATRESLYRLEGEVSYFAEHLPSLADYSIGMLGGEAIR